MHKKYHRTLRTVLLLQTLMPISKKTKKEKKMSRNIELSEHVITHCENYPVDVAAALP